MPKSKLRLGNWRLNNLIHILFKTLDPLDFLKTKIHYTLPGEGELQFDIPLPPRRNRIPEERTALRNMNAASDPTDDIAIQAVSRSDWLNVFLRRMISPIRCQAVWQRVVNATLSLYVGLACLPHLPKSLLEVKVCHLMYAANSHRSGASLGIGDYINEADTQCGNGLLSVCAPRLPLWFLPLPDNWSPSISKDLHRRESCFALSLKTHMGCGKLRVRAAGWKN